MILDAGALPAGGEIPADAVFHDVAILPSSIDQQYQKLAVAVSTDDIAVADGSLDSFIQPDRQLL